MGGGFWLHRLINSRLNLHIFLKKVRFKFSFYVFLKIKSLHRVPPFARLTLRPLPDSFRNCHPEFLLKEYKNLDVMNSASQLLSYIFVIYIPDLDEETDLFDLTPTDVTKSHANIRPA